jgi:hypothetical protein
VRNRSEWMDHDIRCLLEDADELAEYVLPNFENLGEGSSPPWMVSYR